MWRLPACPRVGAGPRDRATCTRTAPRTTHYTRLDSHGVLGVRLDLSWAWMLYPRPPEPRLSRADPRKAAAQTSRTHRDTNTHTCSSRRRTYRRSSPQWQGAAGPRPRTERVPARLRRKPRSAPKQSDGGGIIFVAGTHSVPDGTRRLEWQGAGRAKLAAAASARSPPRRSSAYEPHPPGAQLPPALFRLFMPPNLRVGPLLRLDICEAFLAAAGCEEARAHRAGRVSTSARQR